MSYQPNNANGQATMANSAPVVIASNQSNLPNNNAQVAGTATSVNNGTVDAGTQRVTIASDSTGIVFAKLKDASGNNTSVQTVGDAMAAAPTTTLGAAAFNLVYNGTNFLRQRGDTSGAYQVIRDAAGNARGANVTSGNSLQTDLTSVGGTTHSATNPVFAQAIQKDTFGSATAFTISLGSLANSTAGVGRQSTLVTGNTARSAMIACKIQTGTTPTINTLIYVYLIRGDGTINDDNAGASDAGLTVINTPLLGTILVNSASSNVTYYALFDTKPLGSLGSTFGVAVVNSTGVALNATGGNHVVEYTLMT